MSFIVNLTHDDASRDVAAVHAKLASPEQQRALMNVVGVRAEMELRAWWIRRDAENPNAMGWPRQHFWARIAKRTAFDPSRTTERAATVVVADPALNAKIHGAVIKPTNTISPVTGKPRRALALPMNAEAYGKLPSSGLIPGLFVFRSASGGAFLVKKEGSGPTANLTFYYRLVPSVTVPKEPQALPPADQLGGALSETARDWYAQGGPS
jgi:hypothetical protein